MLKILSIIFLVMPLLSACVPDSMVPVLFQYANPADSVSTLVIQVTNIPSTKGKINLAIFNNETDFNSTNNPLVILTKPVTADTMYLIVDHIEKGNYAFSIYHDENDDNILNTNTFGIPTEYFAFSNNAFGTFGPPSFSKASFSCNGKTDIYQSINLIHF